MRLDPPLIVTLPFASPSQNQTNRWHWSKKKKMRETVALIARMAMRRRGIPADYRAERRMRVEVVRYSAGTLDFGNLVGGFKHCLDALVDAGAIRDDSPTWVDEHYSQSKMRDDGIWDAATVVTISEVP